ncbi:MAG: RHS repeat-associated core domain-containing protein, partial [Sulfurifustis sp.]
ITSVSATVNGGSQNVDTSRTYRPDGLLLSQTYGNGIAETKQYDLQGRLTNQFLGSADTRVYGYDANSNLTSLQSLPQVRSYTYDALDRLTIDSITSTPSSTITLSYDPNGNRTSDGTNTYSYTANSNQLNQVGSNSITTDAAGNITNDGTNTYSYNNDGHLQSVTLGATTLGSYVYNYQRQRTQKTANSNTTVYHYDTNGNLILETATDGTSQVSYVYADSIPIAQITRSGGIDTVTYLHTDHEGTPRLGTDNFQTVVWRWEGRAFGDTAPTGTATVNLRYPGQYADTETGLYYNSNRYYDPRTGRYITSDPVGLAGGFNSYGYVDNSPLSYVDPDGLSKRRGGMPEPSPSETAARAEVQRLSNEIRRYDPNFRYEVASSGSARYNRDDVERLENTLRIHEREGQCYVIGRRPDTAVAAGWPGHNVLNIPNWTPQRNAEWIQNIINQRAPVYLGSPQTPANLWDPLYNRPTIFSQELQQLRNAGYRQVGDYLLPPF